MSSDSFQSAYKDFLSKQSSNNSNPFQNWKSKLSEIKLPTLPQSYLPLPTQPSEPPTFAQQAKSFFQLSASQRIVGFVILSVFGIFCFIVSFMMMPLIPIAPYKFALTFTLGSLLSISSIAVAMGPLTFISHSMSSGRRWWSLGYFGSLFMTLYVALSLRNYILMILCIAIQLIVLVFFYVSYLPGGSTGIQFITRRVFRSVSSQTLPI